MAANVATVPASCSDPGIPVSINNVNCLNPYAPPGGLNCNCYRNNDLEDGGGAIDTEMDGLTETFFATTTINPGVNSIKIAIADAGDWVLDSNVFIKCESFRLWRARSDRCLLLRNRLRGNDRGSVSGVWRQLSGR